MSDMVDIAKYQDCSMEHFERVALLAMDLKQGGTLIRYHRYEPDFNGYWCIAVCNATHALRFIWDEREHWLDVEKAPLAITGYDTLKLPVETEWTELAIESFDRKKPCDPFQNIRRWVATELR